MGLKFNSKQIEKLSELFLDLSKGLILGGFTIPVFTQGDYIIMLKLLIAGVFATYASLKLIDKL